MKHQETNLSLARHKKVSLRLLPGFSEVWLHDQICKDTNLLGLGELSVIDRERVQISGGRLDLLLTDSEEGIRYETEIMLGATDPSHIIRCIEYWDIERRRYPAYDHVAVLVAEEVTSRFLNVMALLAGSIPLIAIQLNALQVGDQIVLDFVKVLDQRVLREDDTTEIGGEDVDRGTWEAKVGTAHVQMCDRVLAIANEVAKPELELKYKKGHMAVCAPGSFFNVFPINPKKAFVRLRFQVSELEQWIDRLNEAGIDASTTKGGRMAVRLRGTELIDNEDLLRELIHQAVREYQA